jgi:type I restriction-modification system DNA methylase subunit
MTGNALQNIEQIESSLWSCAERSTLSHDAFPAQEFDFMLANPPYGKSWKKDLEAIGFPSSARVTPAGTAPKTNPRMEPS